MRSGRPVAAWAQSPSMFWPIVRFVADGDATKHRTLYEETTVEILLGYAERTAKEQQDAENRAAEQRRY